MPNSAKSQASNMTPRKQRVNRFLCQRENGRRSRRPTSSADLLSIADTDMDFPLKPRFLCTAQRERTQEARRRLRQAKRETKSLTSRWSLHMRETGLKACRETA